MGRTKKPKHYDYDYSLRLNYAVVRGSDREERILRVAKGFGTEPSAELIDRILERADELVALQKGHLEEAARLEKEAAYVRSKVFGLAGTNKGVAV